MLDSSFDGGCGNYDGNSHVAIVIHRRMSNLLVCVIFIMKVSVEYAESFEKELLPEYCEENIGCVTFAFSRSINKNVSFVYDVSLKRIYIIRLLQILKMPTFISITNDL